MYLKKLCLQKLLEKLIEIFSPPVEPHRRQVAVDFLCVHFQIEVSDSEFEA